MHIYHDLLESYGIAPASASDIATALCLLYTTLQNMEPEQRAVFFDLNCSAVDAAEAFAAHEDIQGSNTLYPSEMIVVFKPDFEVEANAKNSNVIKLEDYR